MLDLQCLSRTMAGAALLGAALAPASASARANDELAGLINAYRAAPGACDGNPAAPVPPLARESALSRVRIGTGTFLESALKSLGYRSDRAEAISVTGPPDAQGAMAVIQQKYCRTLLSSQFSAVGTARIGNEWQVVLAHPLVIPVLPDWQQAGQQVMALINQARATPRMCGDASYGAAPPLSWNPALAKAALEHSSDMAERHYFAHKAPDGSDASIRSSRAGYRWTVVGENIASGQRTVEEAVAAWLGSPGHCANIMNPRFTETGAAYAINPGNENRTAFWTQVFALPGH